MNARTIRQFIYAALAAFVAVQWFDTLMAAFQLLESDGDARNTPNTARDADNTRETT